MRAQGTTTVEIKSGYGLTVADEERALRLARRGHAGDDVPRRARRAARAPTGARYVDLVTGPMLAACAPYARWIDVFCEPRSPHAFDGDEAARRADGGPAPPGSGCACTATSSARGRACGWPSSSARPASTTAPTSTDADVDALAGGDTVATLLPGVEFSTRSPYPDARRLLDAGVTVALATDCNPGTCYSSSMPLMIALAVREMGMTPGRGAVGGDRGRRAGAAAHRRRRDRGRAPAPTSRCWTRRATGTWPTGRGCRSRGRWSWSLRDCSR